MQEYLMKELYQNLRNAQDYPGISVIEFIYFSPKGLPHHDRINIFASEAALADPVQAGCMLVLMYCWERMAGR